MSKHLRTSRLWLAAVLLAAMGAWAASPSNLQRALDAQHALVAAQPGSAPAQIDLGNLLLLAGDTPGAKSAYEKAVQLDAQSAAGHFNLGLLLQREGENSKALKEYKRVLEIDPKHAWAYYRAGEIDEARGLDGSAIKSYASAFALDPTLRFPDVNPSVIDNHLLTQALLRAYRDYTPERQAPVVFAEPGRIAKLLLTPKAAQQATDPATAASAPTRAPTPQGVIRDSSATDPAQGKDPSFVRVLGAGDLDPARRTGQVTGGSPVRPGYNTGNDPRSVYYPPPVYTPNPAPQPDEEGGVPNTYYPGAPSTGRLDLKLYHRRPSTWAVSRAAG